MSTSDYSWSPLFEYGEFYSRMTVSPTATIAGQESGSVFWVKNTAPPPTMTHSHAYDAQVGRGPPSSSQSSANVTAGIAARMTTNICTLAYKMTMFPATIVMKNIDAA